MRALWLLAGVLIILIFGCSAPGSLLAQTELVGQKDHIEPLWHQGKTNDQHLGFKYVGLSALVQASSLNSDIIDSGNSGTAYTMEQAIQILRQKFASAEQQLLSMTPQQQQLAIYGLQLTISQFLSKVPAEQQPIAIRALQESMSAQLAQVVFLPLLQQPQVEEPSSPPQIPPKEPVDEKTGLMDACLKSGYSQDYCNFLFTGPAAPKLCPRFGVMLPC